MGLLVSVRVESLSFAVLMHDIWFSGGGVRHGLGCEASCLADSLGLVLQALPVTQATPRGVESTYCEDEVNHVRFYWFGACMFRPKMRYSHGGVSPAM